MKAILYIVAATLALGMGAPSAFAAEAPPPFLLKWGSAGSAPGQFSGPTGIVIDHAGYVYITDTGNNRVQKFDSYGNFVLAWGDPGVQAGNMLQPTSIAINQNNEIYILDSGNRRIVKFSTGGVLLSTGYSLPYIGWGAMAVDPEGNVQVTDVTAGGGRFDASCNYLGPHTYGYNWGLCITSEGCAYASTYEMFVSGGCPSSSVHSFNVREPYGIAVDAQHNVFFADYVGQAVWKFGPDGTLLSAFGFSGSSNGQCNHPMGVAVTPAGLVYVVDQGNNRIQVFGNAATPATATTWGHIKSLYR